MAIERKWGQGWNEGARPRTIIKLPKNGVAAALRRQSALGTENLWWGKTRCCDGWAHPSAACSENSPPRLGGGRGGRSGGTNVVRPPLSPPDPGTGNRRRSFSCFAGVANRHDRLLARSIDEVWLGCA